MKMSTNVAKKSKQKPAGMRDKIALTGITPIEIKGEDGKYIFTTVPGREFRFSGVTEKESCVEINAYNGSKPKELKKETGTGRGE